MLLKELFSRGKRKADKKEASDKKETAATISGFSLKNPTVFIEYSLTFAGINQKYG